MPLLQRSTQTSNPFHAALLLLASVAAALPLSAAPPAPLVPVAEKKSSAGDPLQLVWERINRERAAKNLPPVLLDPLLTLAAQAHARDMLANDYFDHTDRQGAEPADRAKRAGYPSQRLGENIAWGQDDAAEVMDTWMRSDGHRENILGPDYHAVGIGIAGKYWVQVFGDSVSPGSRTPILLPMETPDPRRPVPILQRLADFEGGGYMGWELSGNCWGSGPETLAFAGTVLTGWTGLAFATTAHRRDTGFETTSGTGSALSAPFVIPPDATLLRFRIAGGRYPDRCCLNLIVDGRVVRTATGASIYRLDETEWSVTDLRQRTARLEIRDDVAVGANAFIHVDDIMLVRQPPPPKPPKSSKPPASKKYLAKKRH